MRRIAFTLGFLVALAGQALAQFPQTMPPNTVFGRMGVSAGPGQAIPFATLGAQLAGGETTVNDVNYALIAADRTIAYTAISAARTVTLLSASAYPPGTKIYLLDHSGSSSPTLSISAAPTGADTINGANASIAAVTQPYGISLLETDGISKWTLQIPSSTSPTTGGTSVLDYGAKCDGATNDTVSIQAALNSGKPNIYLPSGTCLSAALTIPTTIKLLGGAGTLKASGVIALNGTLLLATNCSGLSIQDLSIDVNTTTYPTVNSIAFVTGTNCKVENVTYVNAGRFGVYIGGCTGCAIENTSILNFVQSGIFFSVSEGAITNQRIAHNVITGNASQTGHTVDFGVVSTDTAFIDNYVSVSSAGASGLSAQAWVRGIIARNIFRNTKAEAIIAYGTQTAVFDNDLSWDAGVSTDYGMSSVAAGDSMVIARNRIYRPAKTGIAVGSTATRYIIEDNQIIDANNSNNGTDGDGIDLLGTSNSIVVRRNYIVNQNTAFIRYCIREFNSSDSNRFEGNYCYAPVTSDYLVIGPNSKIVYKYDLTALNPNGNSTFLGMTVSSLTIGSSTFAIGGNTSLPAIVQGDVWYGSAAGVISALAKSTTATRYLSNTGTTNNPAWAQIDLTNGVTGALPGVNGGTGLATAAIGDIIYASATTPTWSRLADVATGSVLVSGGTNTAPAWSAAPTITTSVTTPIDYGGSTASSTKTIASTSGTGTTDAILFQTGSQVFAGGVNTSQQWTMGPNVTPAAGVKLVVNKNTVAAPLISGAGSVTAQFVSANGVLDRVAIIAPGSIPILNFISSGSAGTLASPSATQLNDFIGAFGAFGYGATGYGTGGGGAILFQATQNWTDAAQGAQVIFQSTPNGTTASVNALTIQNSGGVSVGTAADPGINSFAAANYFAGATAGVTCGAGLGASTRTIKGIVTTC